MSWTLIFVNLILFLGISGTKLTPYISHYEPLNYNHTEIQTEHVRIKRWLNSYEDRYKEEPEIQLNFKAHSKHFKIKLKRDTEIFSQSLSLEGDPKFSAHHAVNLFSGHLDGLPSTSVHGSIVQGVFAGKIIFPNETFYVERAFKYFQNPDFHSIIYSESDLNHEEIGDSGCGSHAHIDWMKKVQNSESNKPNYLDKRELNETDHTFTISRMKRETKPANAKPKEMTTCTLHIRTDPMFWRQIAEQKRTKDKTLIREEILSIIGQHVKAANDIFSNTLFKFNEEMFKNIRFVVQTIKIDTDEECEPNYNGSANPFCADNIDVSNFLEIHSRENHEAFCLSYAFTYRDFTGGVIGLAWVASLSASGGICQRQSTFYDSGLPLKRSLNTGIVTFLNYGRHLPSRLSELTFTHEMGHNFGSPHDPEECQPGGTVGNYVMYASSTNGYLPNNAEFSKCSIATMSQVLDQAFNSPTRRNCFIATDGAFCGNQIVEEGEECDCGYTGSECTDICCHPRKENENDKGNLGCKRKPQAQCSPTEGPCCQPTSCQFSTKIDKSSPCKNQTECTENSYCNGHSAACPIPIFKPNNTECNRGSQVCINGECRGSICLKHGLSECFLSSAQYTDKRELCKIACYDQMGFCKPTSQLGIANFQNLSLRPGSPCDNFKGYCDVFLKCRKVDEKGPLLKLKRFFFNRSSYKGLWDWCVKNWWAVTLMSIGFVILMGLFIKCCAVHTPSSNPYLAKRVKFSQTIRRPMASLRKQPKPERNRGPGPDYGATVGDERFPMEPRYP